MSEDLFDHADRYPQQPGFKERDTSKEAAESMKAAAPLLRQHCLASLRSAPGTADEIAGRLGKTVLAIRPRITELLREGLIEPTGERRANSSGRSAKVWRTR